MTDNRTTEFEQSKYKPPYDARPMRMLRHHIECDCLATRRGVLREIEDLFAIELKKRDERIAELEQTIAATLGNEREKQLEKLVSDLWQGHECGAGCAMYEECRHPLDDRCPMEERVAELGSGTCHMSFIDEYETAKGEFVVPLEDAMEFTTDPPGYVKAHIAKLQASLEEANKAISQHSEANLLMGRTIDEKNATIAELQVKLERCEQVNRQRRENYAELQAKLDELYKSCDMLRDKKLDAQARVDELERKLKTTEKKLHDKEVSRDHWQKVASKQAQLKDDAKKQLKAERDLARTWPRYEDGRPVRIDDEVIVCNEQFKLFGIEFNGSGTFLLNGRGSRFFVDSDYPAKHAPLKAKDGEPIEVGQLLYGGDGKCWLVNRIFHGEKYPIVATEAGYEECYAKCLKAEWLTHEKPDSLESIRADMLRINGDSCWAVPREVIADRIEKLAKEES